MVRGTRLGMFMLGLLISTSAQAERFAFDDRSGKIGFHMVASLHDVDGSAQNFSGELMVGEDTPTGKVVIQASQLTTGLEVRDRRMYSYCLGTDQYPTVELNIAAVEGDVDGLNRRRGEGDILLRGQMKIRAATRDVSIPARYRWVDGALQLTGTHRILWTDYGVPDPSIIISTLYPELDFHFDVRLSPSP